MSTNDVQNSPSWKKPDEVMQLHRLKRKKKALQERMRQPFQSCPDLSRVFNSSPDYTRILGEKRKNPFSKNSSEKDKIFCNRIENDPPQDESTDSTLFQLLRIEKKDASSSNERNSSNSKLTTFTNILNNIINKDGVEAKTIVDIKTEGKHYIPIDWTLKTKLRLMSPKIFAWNQKLKASEEASGITGFVRCLDTSNSRTLDTSHHARFHQNCLYWQHPNIPWINLFPRTTGRVANKNFVASNDEIKDALHKEWIESFRSLFQLLRARQCPYFYVCANNFTCLFRAAGIGGIAETCAFIAPTTRGFRQVLKQEEIEYTMPLKKQEKKKHNLSSEDKDEQNTPKNSSFDSCYDTLDNTNTNENLHSEEEDEDDMESDEWLQSLGVAADEIKKINESQMRLNQAAESSIDSSAESLVCVKGVDAQALFNFLLNCKSSVASTGTFGGIPPTLLSPTAFQGGTLKCLKVRENVVHSEGGKYFSVELRGPILPTTIHSLCKLLQNNSNPFSVTFANSQHTVAFSRAAQLIANDEKLQDNPSSKAAPSVFGRENLSDCGLDSDLLQHFCSSESSIIQTIDSLKYCSEKKDFIWS